MSLLPRIRVSASRLLPLVRRRYSQHPAPPAPPSNTSPSASGTFYPSGSPSSPQRVLPSNARPVVPYKPKDDSISKAHRKLPDPPNRWPLYAATFIVAITSWVAFIAYATNAERSNSSIVRSILFHLRSSELATRALGEGVAGVEMIPGSEGPVWVKGHINTMQGSVDLAFKVKGSHSSGKIYFTSVRRTKSSPFEIIRWRIIRDSDGAVFNLREELESSSHPASSEIMADLGSPTPVATSDITTLSPGAVQANGALERRLV